MVQLAAGVHEGHALRVIIGCSGCEVRREQTLPDTHTTARSCGCQTACTDVCATRTATTGCCV